jgi:large subunit ribosomal protein L28
MARQCSVCGKGRQLGNQVTTRGKKKYLGGVGTKITGITRREFRPNLQRVKVTTATGGNKAVLVCVQCIRSGGVTKVVRAAPFKVPHDPSKMKAKTTTTKKK